MGDDRRVTLVILTHDRRAEVVSAVARALALPERPRVVVVDNASPDGTAEELRRRFPAVDVVALSANAGAAGRNVGIARAETPYVALSDDDTWWAPGALGRAADVLDGHPRVAVLAARVLVGHAEREDPTCAAMAASPLPRDPTLPGPSLLGFLAGAAVVRRSAFLSVGGFEPRFFLGAEEALVGLDLSSAGWALVYAADVVAHHHPSARRNRAARRSLLTRNHLWLAWLRRPLPTALRTTREIVLAARGDPAALRGVLAAVVGLPWVYRRRRVVSAPIERALRQLAEMRPRGDAGRDSRARRGL